MRAFWLLPLLTTALAAEPVRLRCEHQVNPVGIDAAAPRFSWQNDSIERDWRQTAYELLVATTPDRLERGKADVWTSGTQPSSESASIVYAGPKLESRRRYYWTVRVWDAARRASRYAPAAWFETGLLAASDWTAKWISRTDPEAEGDRADIRWLWASGEDATSVPLKTRVYFRLSAIVNQKPVNAALFLTARGDFTASVNGHELRGKTRSWAAFDRQDVAEYFVPGANTIEVSVTAAVPADTPEPESRRVPAALAGLLKIVRTDGVMQRFPTDEHWEARVEGDRNWRPAAAIGELGAEGIPASDPGALPAPAALLRSPFVISKGFRSARLYVTALGSYRMYLNGRQVGSDVLTPEFTDYRKRVLYQTYDVTSMLAEGDNVIGAILGDGWFGSALSWYGNRFFFGKGPARLLAQLEITYRDGSRRTVATGNTWRTAASPVLYSEIYGGEVQDARLDQPGWNRPGFAGDRWTPAVEHEAPPAAVSSQIGTPVRVTGSVTPKSVTPRPGGAYIFDMGQNMVGWVTLKATGPAGTRIRLQFAEILKPDGGIYVDNLRGANATDVFVLAGKGEETFAPYFTFHGFRYVEVTGYPGTPALTALTGEVVNSLPAEPAARLTTSSNLVNRFYEVGIWGQRGNFLSLPTDCPQRDERLGWTGDAAAFWRTGAYNFDIAAFTTRWMQDVRDTRTPEGAFTNTAPNVPNLPEGAPGWGDAGVIVPWTAWMQYGDTSYIERNWDAMQRWMAYIQEGNPDFLRRNRVGPNFADWLAPDDRTNKDLIATAYWAHIAGMMSQMARAAGKEAEAAKYDTLFASIRDAFQKAYIKDTGVVDVGTQTSYVLALNMKLAPPALEPALVANLVKEIDARGGHLSTGFLGTPFLLFALADHGRLDVAYKLLLNETYPSWGYMISKGATTWWERWNSDTGDPAMNSFNHYAFGSVVAWVYRYVAGIDAGAPGFSQVVIRPRVAAGLTAARAEYDSIRGRIVSDWNGSADGPFTLKVTIPANTSARVYLPAPANTKLTEGGKPVQSKVESGSHLVEIGSGTYEFQVK